MKTISKNLGKPKSRTNKLFFTATMLATISTAWFLGSMNTSAFSQPTKLDNGLIHIGNNILLPSITIHKEALPTIFLTEITIEATQNKNL